MSTAAEMLEQVKSIGRPLASFHKGDTIDVNNKMRKKRIEKDKIKLDSWSKPNFTWHFQNAIESEKENNWFAASFHLKKLLEVDPDNKSLDIHLKIAVRIQKSIIFGKIF